MLKPSTWPTLLFSKAALVELLMLSLALFIAFLISKFNLIIYETRSAYLYAIVGNVSLIVAFFLVFGLTLSKENNRLCLRKKIIPINITVVLIFSVLYLPVESLISKYSIYLTLALLPPIIVLFIITQKKIEHLIDDSKSGLFYLTHSLFFILILIPMIATLIVYLPFFNKLEVFQRYNILSASKFILFDTFNMAWNYL